MYFWVWVNEIKQTDELPQNLSLMLNYWSWLKTEGTYRFKPVCLHVHTTFSLKPLKGFFLNLAQS